MDMHSDAIEQAEAAHSEMSAPLVKAREDLAAKEARRHEIALAAETGSGEARREPAPLAKAATMLRDNIEHGLDPAVAEGEQHVAAAPFKADNEAKRPDGNKSPRGCSTPCRARRGAGCGVEPSAPGLPRVSK